MKEIRNPERMQHLIDRLRRQGKSIGFVPTMGALHEGHCSLVRKARKENDVAVASLFVNPAQFGPHEDFKRYPKPLREDRKILMREKIDFLFHPSARDMYPEGFDAIVAVGGSRLDGLSRILCGKFRPGHFQGVATIVTKLFNVIGPCRAYFGAKDYQQSVIIRRLINDLNFNVDLKVLPTVRDREGLAMSSRNRYLNAAEKRRAGTLPRVLFWIRKEIKGGRKDMPALRRQALRKLRTAVDRVDYLEIVDPGDLKKLKKFQGRMVALAACYVGKTRLIDNVIIRAQRG